MYENVISRTTVMRQDDRTLPERQLVKKFGVEIFKVISDRPVFFDADRSYAQVFWTRCGRRLVVSASREAVQGALCTAEWEWAWGARDERENYNNMCAAAGITFPGNISRERWKQENKTLRDMSLNKKMSPESKRPLRPTRNEPFIDAQGYSENDTSWAREVCGPEIWSGRRRQEAWREIIAAAESAVSHSHDLGHFWAILRVLQRVDPNLMFATDEVFHGRLVLADCWPLEATWRNIIAAAVLEIEKNGDKRPIMRFLRGVNPDLCIEVNAMLVARKELKEVEVVE